MAVKKTTAMVLLRAQLEHEIYNLKRCAENYP